MRFFFHGAATPEIYTLSLHDALPILVEWPWADRTRRSGRSSGQGNELWNGPIRGGQWECVFHAGVDGGHYQGGQDRKSTRLNSSHPSISYAVFCLKKKKKNHE